MLFRLFSTVITTSLLLVTVFPASATILSLPRELSSQLSERQVSEKTLDSEMLISGRARRARRRANRQQRREDRFNRRMCRRFGDC